MMTRLFIPPTLYRPSINIIEVGLRDGLQNESKLLHCQDKTTYLNHMISSGLRNIEIGSFVSPKWVPQMKDTKQLIQSLDPSVRQRLYLSALVPNQRGIQDAIDCKVDEIVLFLSTTDTFNKKNINNSKEEVFKQYKELTDVAKKHNMKVRGSISCCFHCPYEGKVDVQTVIDTVLRFKELDVDMIDIADTIGAATPTEVKSVLSSVVRHVDTSMLSAHFHDTNGCGIENVYAAIDQGIHTIHSSLGGTGGCPYSSKRVGNLNTIRLVEWCEKHNIQTNVNLDDLYKGQEFIQRVLRD